MSNPSRHLKMSLFIQIKYNHLQLTKQSDRLNQGCLGLSCD